MPYVIKERLSTAGKYMYLLRTPFSDDSVGVWTEKKENAKKFDTLREATAASGKLSVLSSGIPEHYSPQTEDNMSDSDWVIKSNITNEYIVQAQVYREPEIWSHKLSEALRFGTTVAARDFASDYLLGKRAVNGDGVQTLDIDYIAVPKKKRESGKDVFFQDADVLFQDTAENGYHFVIGCNATQMYLKRFFWADRTVEWITDIKEAKQFKYRASAQASAERVNNVSVVTSIYVVDSKTHKIVQNKLKQSLEKEEMLEKRNFRVQMKHEVGYQIDVTYTDTTEIEALDQMFLEVKKMSNRPFTAGLIKMYEEKANGAGSIGKSM